MARENYACAFTSLTSGSHGELREGSGRVVSPWASESDFSKNTLRYDRSVDLSVFGGGGGW
jgi:hypothetical protein